MTRGVADSDRFAEDLWVRETSVIVGAPPTTLALRPGRVDPLDPNNWLVLEDGRPAELLRVEPVSGNGAEPWEVWIWSDSRLLGATAPEAVTAALAQARPALARLGPLADEPLLLGARRAETRPLLSEVAAALDRLLLDAAERPIPSAGLLILPAAPLRLSTAAWNALAHGDPSLAGTTERGLVRSLIDAAEGLAAMGWTPIVLAPSAGGGSAAAIGDQRGALGGTWQPPSGGAMGGSTGVPFPVVRSGSGNTVDDHLLQALETALSTELLPWRRFAAFSHGWVVRDGAGLAKAARAVGERYRLWYRTTHPPDGEDGRLDVRWLHNGASMLENFPRRRGIAEAVARARVRYLSRYGVDRLGPLALTARALATPADEPARISLRIALGPAPTTLSPPPPAWLRLSCAGQAEIWAGLRVAARSRQGGAFESELRCAGSPGRGWIALVEDLETGLWGVAAAVPAAAE